MICCFFFSKYKQDYLKDKHVAIRLVRNSFCIFKLSSNILCQKNTYIFYITEEETQKKKDERNTYKGK